jgi:hypothetical protein
VPGDRLHHIDGKGSRMMTIDEREARALLQDERERLHQIRAGLSGDAMDERPDDAPAPAPG